MNVIEFREADLQMLFGITDTHQIRLLHFSTAPWSENLDRNFADQQKDLYLTDGYQFAQVQLAGINSPYERHGNIYTATMPGCRMIYKEHKIIKNELGQLLVISQEDEESGIRVTSFFQSYHGLSCVRVWHRLDNIGNTDQILTYLGSFSYLGWEKEGTSPADEKIRIHVPHHGWQKELNWQAYSLPELGLVETQSHVMHRSSATFEVTNTGNWSTKTHLPMAFFENEEVKNTLFFQIEHNGSWHWEIGLQDNHFFLNISGPTYIQGHFAKKLTPGQSFTSVPVCVGCVNGTINEAAGQLVQYRRRIRRKNKDNENLPIIFNDYMNCLFGDPTTEKEIPLIDAAKKAGCEYYVIDAGWYANGTWWENVGEWKESRQRFPGGLRKLTDYIRSQGMIPGLWLELETMGINCPLVKSLPEDWFFSRFDHFIYDRSRLQLDFRNPEVRAWANSIIDRLVNEYGAGYIKMDYNIEPGPGTERNAFTVGEGLLDHERAYLKWLDDIFLRYPDLVIENCSSGGLRMDYAIMSRCSIQSTSDQEDYVHYAMIAANAPSGVNSEQSAVWSYPQRDADDETVAFNMINAMMGRIHQSGHLAELQKSARQLVEEGLMVYREMRKSIPQSLPFWPLGFAHARDPFACLALQDGNNCYLALWHKTRNQANLPVKISIPLAEMPGALKLREPEILYPRKENMKDALEFSWDASNKILHIICRKAPCARLFSFVMSEK